MKRSLGLFCCLCLFVVSCKNSGPPPDIFDIPKDIPKDIPEHIPGNTAHGSANTYTGHFLYGSNMGWLNSHWKDEDIADILTGNESRGQEGVGANSLRPALPEHFVETWGYDNKVGTFQHYAAQGAKHNVVFIGDGPCELHREKRQYAPGLNSQSYENLYAPIWTDTGSGRSVNEQNPYAMYVYKLVQNYKNHVKFWEIKNEPDFTHSSCGWAGPQSECNWWDRDPLPEELVNWHAPIQSYVRMLRVSYEVIKSVDPTAYVCVGGIGYESFLDAILRNTDNPDKGRVTERHPLQGGAWFDCLSFHIYPMYSLRYWGEGGWNFFRHSDGAVGVVQNQSNTYGALLKKYGYGLEFPSKEVIVTETNLPGKRIGEFVGSEEAQRNYLMKLAVVGQKQQIRGIYPFGVWDNKERSAEGGEYDFMGFYKPLPETPAGALRPNASARGWKTTSKWLRGRSYDEEETQRLVLPAGVEGGAFYSEGTQDYVYVLWAKTTQDLSEEASLAYTFPASMNVQEMSCVDWKEAPTHIPGNTLQLGGAPVFVKIK